MGTDPGRPPFGLVAGAHYWIALDDGETFSPIEGLPEGPHLVRLEVSGGRWKAELCSPRGESLDLGTKPGLTATYSLAGGRLDLRIHWLARIDAPPPLPPLVRLPDPMSPPAGAPSPSARAGTGPRSLPARCELRDVQPPMLRCARAFLALSQDEVARGAGVSSRTVVNAEQGPVSEKVLLAIAAFLTTRGIIFRSDGVGREIAVEMLPPKAPQASTA